MIQMFRHPDHATGNDTIRIVYDGGDGGIYEVTPSLELVEVDNVPGDWVQCITADQWVEYAHGMDDK